MTFRFERYCLDGDRRELWCGPDRVRIEPQVFDVLFHLVQNRSRIVTKDDLVAGVWNGRIVSESTLSSRVAAVRQVIGDDGARQHLVRTIPRKGYRFVGSVREDALRGEDTGPAPTAQNTASPAIRIAPALASRDLSIAVLPFANLSGGLAQEYFIDGVSEDITTALSHFRWLHVIARGSSAVYKHRTVDARQAGHELGARYLLEGSTRETASNVLVTARLIDATSGTVVWADRFGGQSRNILEFQDHITTNVIGGVVSQLEQTEREHAKHQQIESPGAYELYLRGLSCVYQWTRPGINKALRAFRRAIKIDREFAPAYGMAAYCFVQRKSNGWFTNRSSEIANCARLIDRAVVLGKDDAVTLTRAALAAAYVVGDVETGTALIDRALSLNPHLSAAWYVSSWLSLYSGRPDVALRHVHQAMRLSSPFDPLSIKLQSVSAYVHFFDGRYDEAFHWAGLALRAQPRYLTALRGAAASCALAGRVDEAKNLVARLRGLDPMLGLSNLKNLFPLRGADDFDRWARGLEKAGLPD